MTPATDAHIDLAETLYCLAKLCFLEAKGEIGSQWISNGHHVLAAADGIRRDLVMRHKATLQ
jgi:hypothetical protein